MKIVDTYFANIYVGFREQYSEIIHAIGEAEEICKKYCDRIGLCVTITPIKFIYKGGQEIGCVIGLINYPRFPEEISQIRTKAFEIAKIFKEKFKQNRISIICSDKTYMMEEDN